MLSRLHTKDPMSVEELLNPPEENIIVEEPTDEDFCGVSEVPVDAADALDNPDEEVVDDDVEEELDPEEIKDHLKWIGKLLIRVDATGVLDRSVSGLREMQWTLCEELGRMKAKLNSYLSRGLHPDVVKAKLKVTSRDSEGFRYYSKYFFNYYVKHLDEPLDNFPASTVKDIMNAKLFSWLEKGHSPPQVFTKLKLKGTWESAAGQPNFKYFEQYLKMWGDKQAGY